MTTPLEERSALKIVGVEVSTAYEKGGVTTPLEERPALKIVGVEVSAHP